MIDNLIYVNSFSAPDIDRREVLRYAGVRESSPEIEAMLDECISAAKRVLSYKSCYRFFEVKAEGEEMDLGFTRTKSLSLIKNLEGCHKILLFCVTVGSEMDRLIAKYTTLSPARAVLLQAFGSERVEAVCDELCAMIGRQMRDEDCTCTGRFSPGYGDLPLEMQRDIFSALDCTRRIGVNLNDNLFMTPAKSVTAIFGIKNVK